MLVTPDWLARHLGEPDLVVVDLRWREDGSGLTRFERGHVPGAVHCDWAADLVDPVHPVAFMLAPPERFAASMERLGIGDATTVVAYADELGSGPFRLWWACRVHGHDQVRILDGGLERWTAERHPVERGPSAPRAGLGGRWTPRAGEALIATGDDVAAAEGDPSVTVLDSRPPSQFRGEEVWFETGAIGADSDGVAHTPRGDLRAGRIPWARNVPVGTLYRQDHTLKGPVELRTLLEEAGVRFDHDGRVITSCGVGISASALLYAAHLAGVPDVRLYDGSWDEWSRDPARPVRRDPSGTRSDGPG
jgi:thiosulfate/3-mercaptopyruvate sulfurtransferase